MNAGFSCWWSRPTPIMAMFEVALGDRNSLETRSHLTQEGHPEGESNWEYLPTALSNQPDSGDRRNGQKTHVACNQIDDFCGVVAAAFDAPADGTGAGIPSM